MLALENAVYSVISPEGCASILWRSPEAARQAAVAMRVSAADQRALGIVDTVVAEPPDGAQTDVEETARLVADAIVAQLELLVGSDPDELVDARYARYRGIGAFTDVSPPPPPRRERRRVSDRIRDMLGSGRSAIGVPESAPLRPQPVEDAEDPPLHEEI